jgi:hypothetical protein
MLQRRLVEENASFADLVEQVRRVEGRRTLLEGHAHSLDAGSTALDPMHLAEAQGRDPEPAAEGAHVLQRRLVEENASFADLVEQVRRVEGRRTLLEGQLDIAQTLTGRGIDRPRSDASCGSAGARSRTSG